MMGTGPFPDHSRTILGYSDCLQSRCHYSAAIIPQPLPRPIRPLSLLPLGVMVNDPVGRKDMK